VNERNSNVLMAGAAVLSAPLLLYLAYHQPGYFTSSTYLGGLVFLECLLAAIWFYRSVFFPLVTAAFLFAGMDLPLGGVWITARWFVLATAALVGCLVMLKERRLHFRWFHLVATAAVLAALVSAAVSRYPGFAILKALSLLLLFVYTGTGARLAVLGRENRFFNGLLIGCEMFVGGLAVLYALGIEAMGNPNSLGAVMGVVAVPILLWGAMLHENVFVHHRREFLCVIALYLTFHSQSRSGMVAAFVSCGLFCLALRRYKLFVLGTLAILILITSSAIFEPEQFSKTLSSMKEQIVYKGKDPALGVLGSRQTPWQEAMDSIHTHFWLGSGFGTSDRGQDDSQFSDRHPRFTTTDTVRHENGSSYLTILTWVGIGGAVPFYLLLVAVVWSVFRTISWMWNTANPSHPAIPLAMVVLGGLVNAVFEDWLFAVGYYLCVFFWSLAFILADFAPSVPVLGYSMRWRPRVSPQQDWTDVSAVR
jgi:O-antigen ligase